MTKEEYIIKLRDDALLFGRVVMPNTFTMNSPEFHYELADIYHDETKRLVNIIAPRGHAKTSVATALALHHLVYGSSRIKFIVIVSRTQGHSINILQTIKDVLDFSTTFRAIYGVWGRATARKWTDDDIELKDGSKLIAKGILNQLVGLNHLSQRPTFVLTDDVEDTTNTKTKESIDNNLKAIIKDLEPGLDPIVGRIFNIGTPQRDGCLVLKLKAAQDWHTRHYDSIVDEEKKLTLWPERFSWERLEEKRISLSEMGKASVYYSEYRCQIIGDEEQLFSQEDLRYWKGRFFHDASGNAFIGIKSKGTPYLDGFEYKVEWEDLAVEEIRPVNIFMGVDPASSINQSADYTVIFPIAVDAKNNIFCLPYWRKRAKPMGVAEAILSHIRIYKPEKVEIETVGYQEMLRDFLKWDEIADKLGETSIGSKNQPRDKKSSRLGELQPYFFKHKVHLMEGMNAFQDELLLYPKTQHEDTIDGFYYARKKVYPPYHDNVTKLMPQSDTTTDLSIDEWMLC